MFSSELLTTGNADAYSVTHGPCTIIGNPTGNRAVLDCSTGSLATDEYLATMLTGSSSASIADSSACANVGKRPAAKLTGAVHGHNLIAKLLREVWVVTPKLSIRLRMTGPAQRSEVIKYVGLQIRAESLKRADVVNRTARLAARLADAIIARSCSGSLRLPIRPSVLNSCHTFIIWY